MLRGPRKRNREHNEHYLFFQLSDQPLGPMETRHPYGLCLRRLGSRLGFVTSLGYRRVDNNLSRQRRLRNSELADTDRTKAAQKAQQQNHPFLKAFPSRTEQLGDEAVGRRPQHRYCRLGFYTGTVAATLARSPFSPDASISMISK
jgi:hypothetical protein